MKHRSEEESGSAEGKDADLERYQSDYKSWLAGGQVGQEPSVEGLNLKEAWKARIAAREVPEGAKEQQRHDIERDEAENIAFEAESDARRHEPYSADLKDDYGPDDEERGRYSDKSMEMAKGISHTTTILRDLITRVNRFPSDKPLTPEEDKELSAIITELNSVIAYLNTSKQEGHLQKKQNKAR